MACKKRKTVIKKGKATEATTAANVSTPVGGFRNTDNELVHITCPNCGSDYINIHDDGDSFYCSSCGNTWDVDSEIKESIMESLDNKIITKVSDVVSENSNLDRKAIKNLGRVFNFINDYIDEECDGYIMSNKVTRKKKKDFVLLQWKIQGIKESEEDINMYNVMKDNKGLSKNYSLDRHGKIINEYQDVVVIINPNEKNEYDRIRLGLLTIGGKDIGEDKYDKSVRLNPSYKGPVIQFTLYIPISEKDMNLNKDISRKGNNFHIVVNTDLVATYDSKTRVWSTVLFTDNEIISTVFNPSNNADEILNTINSDFKYPMDTDEFMNYLNTLKVKSRDTRDRA